MYDRKRTDMNSKLSTTFCPRPVKGCIIIHCVSNEYIRKELKIQSVQNKIDEYRQNWMNLLDRMTDERMPKSILE
jgi:hypothetical protein